MADSETKGPICLLTDFGIEDNYVGVMKGVIQSIAPGCAMIDLSHHIPPQDIRSAAFLLDHSVDYFAQGTIFLCVIDPGVGTHRRKLAIDCGGHYFIGPDNGLLSSFLDEGRVHQIESDRHRLPQVSNTFHGRDIFAPAAAHLCCGVPLADLGPECQDPIRMESSEPTREGEDWLGEVVYVDRFGNLVTNFDSDRFLGVVETGDFRVQTKGGVEWPFARTYAEVPNENRCSVMGGFFRLELSINCGNASNRLGLSTGSQVCLVKS
ncbi:MAG: SAM-dependent chlorinase/fluorinase [Candidatus Omnitrophica bacterium]|nr:SAM-dependent chlorinase/fluorinase [Candidatus Omnitrophota bacterium]